MNNRNKREWARLFASPVAVLTVLNLIGAGVAFIKDVVQAAYLGTSLEADAFTLAYFAPDTLANLLIGSAIGTACIPLFTKLFVTEGEAALHSAVRRVALQTLLFSAVLYIVCLLASPGIVRLFAGDMVAEKEAIRPLLAVMLPMLLIAPFTMVGSALHQARHQFLITVAAPILVPFVSLLALSYAITVGLELQSGALAASWGILIGYAVMTLMIWMPHRKILFSPRLSGRQARTKEKSRPKVWSGSLLIFVILASGQAVLLAERLLASRLETGAVAALNYAYRLSQVPIWVYVAAFGTVMLPKLARQSAESDYRMLSETLRKTLVHILHITIPTTVLLWLFREPVTRMLFYRGSFDLHSVALTSSVLEGYTLTIVFQSIYAIVLKVFLAQESLRAITAASVMTAFFTIGADLALTHWVGVKGLGYGAALGSVFGMAGSILLLKKHIHLRGMWSTTGRLIAANIPPALLVYWFVAHHSTYLDRGAPLLMALLAGAVCIYGFIYLFLASKLKLLKLVPGRD